MKKFLLIAAAVCTAACSRGLEVEVTNTTGADREFESVEVLWEQIAEKGISPENVVVKHDGKEIPSQVLMLEGAPAMLLFQADVEANATEIYTVTKGVRSEYPVKAYGRFVPERLDDYAWENDKVAFRAYGPALETAPGEMLATPGFDTWVKCVDTLVVDARYKRGNYHHNYGDGMDCYKVGRTLGAGASAPFVDSLLWRSRNFATWETVTNGPLRTIVKFTYAPFQAGDREVTLTKFISLDAHSHFNHILNIYEGDFESLPVASGFVRHDVKGLTVGDNYLAMYEAASDSHNPEEDGDLYFAVIQNDAEFIPEIDGHAAAIRSVSSDEPVEYLAGVAWSGAGIENLDAWKAIVEAEAEAYVHPLKVTVK